MIYMDGSSLPFDAQAALSRSIAFIRAETEKEDADPKAEKLCDGFAKYYALDAENVRAAGSLDLLLKEIFPELAEAAAPELDRFQEEILNIFPNIKLMSISKNADMKLSTEGLAAALKDGRSLFFSNPCNPTSLELSTEEIAKLAACSSGRIIVDESYMIGSQQSAAALAQSLPNLIVIRKMAFCGEPVFAVGAKRGSACGISAADQSSGELMFAHPAAIRAAERRLADSRDSLYIRIKKLAVKFESLERLYRARAGFVFFKVNEAEKRAEHMERLGVKIGLCGDYFCVYAGSAQDNSIALEALETVLQ